MKKTLLLLLTAMLAAAASAQQPTDTTRGDTLRAAMIIDNYLGYVNFDRLLGDSMMCIVSHITERSHPQDTILIRRWYGPNGQMRLEMWQEGKMEDALYTDGKKLFRWFDGRYRSWRDLSQITFYDRAIPLDIRGALHNWRSKGAEAFYAGRYQFEGHPVDRIYVTSPNLFDRYYFFEAETGLLFMLTEEDRIFGDAEKAKNAHRVDWRGWHEFLPFHGCLLPTEESYQADEQLVIIHHHYHLEAPRPSLFTDDYRPQ